MATFRQSLFAFPKTMTIYAAAAFVGAIGLTALEVITKVQPLAIPVKYQPDEQPSRRIDPPQEQPVGAPSAAPEVAISILPRTEVTPSTEFATTGHSGRTAAAIAQETAAPSPTLAGNNPFANFAGTWTGRGNIQEPSGARRQVTCRVVYLTRGMTNGTGLSQQISCDGGHRFQFTTDFVQSKGKLSGSWRSSDYGTLVGRVGGKVTSGEVKANIKAKGLLATLAITSDKDQQRIEVRSDSASFNDLYLTLGRDKALPYGYGDTSESPQGSTAPR